MPAGTWQTFRKREGKPAKLLMTTFVKVLFVVYFMIMTESNWFGLDKLPYWALFLNVTLFFWVWDVEGLGPFRAHHCPYTIRGWRTLCYLHNYTNFSTFVNPNRDGRKWLCCSMMISEIFPRNSRKKELKKLNVY